ncbi:MAG: accessory factor UbiK family protein [Castellaniella sp.]
MNQRSDWFEEFQRNVSELFARSPAADIERNIKALMAQTFARLDLVTREEFEVQKTLLERALTRIATLEQRIAALEAQQAGAAPSDPADSAG